jgi:hypothetical protein
MFEKAGWTVVDVQARVLWPERTSAALKAFAPLAQSLGQSEEVLTRNLSAFQWVIRAVNGERPLRLHMAGLGLKKVAGVTEARIDYPLAAMNTLATVRAVWGAGGVSLPKDFKHGVLVLHRQFMQEAGLNAHIEGLIRQGWVIVADMDDDPANWNEYVESNYWAFRSVHAVTVSTEELAQKMRQWNPNVQVFENAVFELPQIPKVTPKQGERVRIFFGALNRGKDWAQVQEGITTALAELGEEVEVVVVHDREIYESVTSAVKKEFHETLPHGLYMKVLASCDVALLPLSNTSFNSLKSDIKFIECCAAGVVPICSPLVYARRQEHQAIGVFAETANEWKDAIVDLCRSPEQIKARRALGVAYVERERMHCQQVKLREAYYRSLKETQVELEVQRQDRLRSLTNDER